MKQFLLVLFALVLFFAVGAGILLALRSIGESSVLSSTQCSPPCWYGVIPGVTTPWQAVEILTPKRWVQLLTQWGETYEETQIGWMFHYPATDSAGYIYCREGTVIAVSIKTMGSLTVADALEEFGEPTRFWLSEEQLPERRTLEVNLLYPETAIIVTADVEWPLGTDPAELVLQGGTPISRVAYVDPQRLGRVFDEHILFHDEPEAIEGVIQPWVGLGPVCPSQGPTGGCLTTR